MVVILKDNMFRLIFLDIDGVMASEDSIMENFNAGIRDEAMTYFPPDKINIIKEM